MPNRKPLGRNGEESGEVRHLNRKWNKLVITLVVVAGVAIGERVEGADKGDAAVSGGATRDYSTLKIVPPPGGGMYIGQHDFNGGNDIVAIETAIGRKVAWWSNLEFDGLSGLAASLEYGWKQGKISWVTAYEVTRASDDPPPLPGFTIDNLLRGKFDVELRKFAAEFRKFGKPVVFQAGREPDGLGILYMGGFGPNGDKTLKLAIENQRGLADFNPSQFPNAPLYAGLGDPNKCDGVERLAAAQRYYHDFFVRREGLNFLTFETMGWAVGPEWEKVTEKELKELVTKELNIRPASVSPAHAGRLLKSCLNFEHFYAGDEYVDWVSINFYLLDSPAGTWPEQDVGLRADIDKELKNLEVTMNTIRKVAREKPVFFMELGFAEGRKKDSKRAAEMLRRTFNELLTRYPEIHGFSMWSNLASADAKSASYWPYDNLIRPNTQQGNALKEIIDANPSKFHSCVYFSDGSMMPNCDSSAPTEE